MSSQLLHLDPNPYPPGDVLLWLFPGECVADPKQSGSNFRTWTGLICTLMQTQVETFITYCS